MTPRELVRQFKEAGWAGSQEVQTFLHDARGASVADLAALLPALIDKRAPDEPRLHALRCAVFRKLVEASGDRELFVPLLKATRGADPVALQTFVAILPTVNNVGGHAELVNLFRHDNPAVREAAAEVLRHVGGKTAFGLLTRLCGQPDFSGRLEAIGAMVAMAGYHAIPALRATLEAGTADEKLQALAYLGSREIITKHEQDALEAISVALVDHSDAVSLRAIEAFAELAAEDDYFRYVVPKLDTGSVTVVQAILTGTWRYVTPRTLALLRDQLLLGPRAVRISVLETLERMESEDVLPIVAEALDHKQIQVRLRAAKVLENLAQRGTIDIARTIVWLPGAATST